MFRKVFILAFFSAFLLALAGRLNPSGEANLQAKEEPPQRAGEEIIYEVRFANLLLGEARLRYPGKVNIAGATLNHLVFQVKVINFSDTENIYSDPKSYLPVRIEREVVSFFKRERIIEDYDQENYRVTITKNNGRTSQQSVIKKKGVIHNAILFSYALRDLKDPKIGRTFNINLPNQSLKITLASIDNLKLGKGDFRAFRFESDPKQISIWISADERRIPVKIEGAGVFGYTLLLKDYRI